jgi:hypothetical protein
VTNCLKKLSQLAQRWLARASTPPLTTTTSSIGCSQLRKPPDLLFLVVWQAGSGPRELLWSAVLSVVAKRRYLCGIAEIARTRGLPGFLRVSVSEPLFERVDERGRTWLSAEAVAEWNVGNIDATTIELRSGPSPRCFSWALDLDGNPRRWFRMKADGGKSRHCTLLADHLYAVKNQGFDEHITQWAVKDSIDQRIRELENHGDRWQEAFRD